MPSSKFGHEQRHPEYQPVLKQQVPGPGACNLIIYLDGQKDIGSSSKFIQKGGYSFGNSIRKEPKKTSNQAPGPG